MTGEVKLISKRPRKGKPYAFISSSNGDYYTNEISGLELGMKVEYMGERNEKGYIARDVRIIT